MTLPDPLHPIEEAIAHDAFAAILNGKVPEAEIGAFLIQPIRPGWQQGAESRPLDLSIIILKCENN